MHRVDAVLNNLAPEDLFIYFDLESEIESLMESIERLANEASTPGNAFYEGRASWARRFSLMIFADHIGKGIAQLEVSNFKNSYK